MTAAPDGTDNSRVTSQRVRDISRAAFGRESQIEVALIVRDLADEFAFDDVITAVLEMCERCEIDAPSEAAVRTDLKRMRETFGALERLPRLRGTIERREVRRPGPLWELCEALYSRAAP